MAVKEVLVDDIDGETEAIGQLFFVVNGQEYTADLNEENMLHYQGLIDEHEAAIAKLTAEHNGLMAILAEYGRPVKPRMGQTQKEKPKRSPKELAEIREWLRGQGEKVSDFGRIRDELLDLWETRSRMPKGGEVGDKADGGADGVKVDADGK